MNHYLLDLRRHRLIDGPYDSKAEAMDAHTKKMTSYENGDAARDDGVEPWDWKVVPEWYSTEVTMPKHAPRTPRDISNVRYGFQIRVEMDEESEPMPSEYNVVLFDWREYPESVVDVESGVSMGDAFAQVIEYAVNFQSYFDDERSDALTEDIPPYTSRDAVSPTTLHGISNSVEVGRVEELRSE